MAERQFGQQLLESDGANPAFFYLLAKENKKSLRSCEMHIPPTLLFEQGYVKAMFSTEQPSVPSGATTFAQISAPPQSAGGRASVVVGSPASGAGGPEGGFEGTQPLGATSPGANSTLGPSHKPAADAQGDWSHGMATPPGEIKRKSGKDVDLEEVFEQFTVNAKPGDIVAELLFAQPRCSEMTEVMFMDTAALRQFLFVNVDKPKSLLQKFVRPKGNNNIKVLATWSPLMMLAEGRRCPYSLTARHLPSAIRGATFEDPTINTVDVVVNRTVVRGINELCCEMAAHFERTERLSMSRFAGYFKVDEHNNLYLMYPTSIRLHEAGTHRAATTAPLNLSHCVSMPANARGKGSVDARAQDALDKAETAVREYDEKVAKGKMTINIPSLEDNYTLIRAAIHGIKRPKPHPAKGNNSSVSRAAGAGGTSSVYLSGPLPANSLALGLNTTAPVPQRIPPRQQQQIKERQERTHHSPTSHSGMRGGHNTSQDPKGMASPQSMSPSRPGQYPSSPAGAGHDRSNISSLPGPNGLSRVVAMTPATALPQPPGLLRHQHVLPNSATNMQVVDDGDTSAMTTLRQLNRRTEQQVQAEWQRFIQNTRGEVAGWQRREVLARSLGFGTDALHHADTLVALNKAVIDEENAKNVAASVEPPPPVAMHTTYDPRHPNRVRHDSPTNTRGAGDAAANAGAVSAPTDKAAYMQLVNSRASPVKHPAPATGETPRAGAPQPAGPLSGRTYEADAARFVKDLVRSFHTDEEVQQASPLAVLQRNMILPPVLRSSDSPRVASPGVGSNPHQQERVVSATGTRLRPLPAPTGGIMKKAVGTPAAQAMPLQDMAPPSSGFGGSVPSPTAKAVSTQAVSKKPVPTAVGGSPTGAVARRPSNLAAQHRAAQVTVSQAKQSVPDDRGSALRSCLQERRTDLAAAMQLLNEKDRAALEDTTQSLVEEIRLYLRELVYAIYDVFLMKKGPQLPNGRAFVYVEVPSKFMPFLSVVTLGHILHKLHGDVRPVTRFLCETLPTYDIGHGDIYEWRRHLLGHVNRGQLQTQWPPTKFDSLGSYLQYCATPCALDPDDPYMQPDSDCPPAWQVWSKMPIRTREDALRGPQPLLPVSVLRRRTIMANSSRRYAGSGTSRGGAETSSPNQAPDQRRGSLFSVGPSIPDDALTTDGFFIEDFIAEFKQGLKQVRDQQKAVVRAERMLERQQRRQERRFRRAAEGKAGLNAGDDNSESDLESDDSEAEAEDALLQAELLEDPGIRDFNRGYALVIPMLADRGLEILRAEDEDIMADAEAFLDLDDGVVPLFIRRYLIDKRGEAARRERLAQKIESNRAERRRDALLRKRQQHMLGGPAALNAGRAPKATSPMAAASGKAQQGQGKASDMIHTYSRSDVPQAMAPALRKGVSVALSPSQTSPPISPRQGAELLSPVHATLKSPKALPVAAQTAARPTPEDPLAAVCPRCLTCRILCLCDKVYIAAAHKRISSRTGAKNH